MLDYLKMLAVGTAAVGALAVATVIALPLAYTSEKDDPTLAEGTTDALE